MNIEELEIGSRIKIEGIKLSEMIVIKKESDGVWLANSRLCTLTKFPPEKKATHFWDGLTWQPFAEETANG